MPPESRALAAWAIATVVLLAPAIAHAQNEPPEAVDDAYETAAGDNLSVDAEVGVLANDDDPDGDPLTAFLETDPVSGGVANLSPDGSFEYEPPGGFIGTDSFTYRAFDGAEFSNVATVEVDVTGAPVFYVFTDETAFRNALAALGLDATTESYEDDDTWGTVRSTIVGGNFTAPAIDSLGVRWTGNNPDSEVLAPGNELGQTPGRRWGHLPPPGGVFYYRVVSP